VTLVIRPAVSPDLDELVAIENECFTYANWQAADFLKHDCQLAEVDGKIAGFLVSREILPGEREILNLAVSRAFRRQGVASALIQHELKRHPGEFFLEVRESNLAAQELYRKFGFVEIGRRPQYYQAPPETAIVMKMK